MRQSTRRLSYVILLKISVINAYILHRMNPIEEFWSKVLAGVRQNALTADDQLNDRICESIQKVTRTICQAWIKHAVSFFPRCELEEKNV
jgi:hypothetical protein